MTPKFHSLRVKNVTKETEDAVSISFDVPTELQKDYTYEAGQYLTLRKEINGEDLRRSYSLCSAPMDGEWTVAVKLVENGLFSTFANNELKAGDILDVMTPMGTFVAKLDSSNNKNYILFAAGSGVTPVLSLTKTILNTEPNSTVTLFYGNRNFKSILFKEEIEAMKNLNLERLRLIHILSRESLGNKIQKGRIDKEKCAELQAGFLQHENADEIFICGPEEMIFAVKSHFEAQGVDAKQIHYELFTSSTPKKKIEVDPNEKQIEANVKVIIDGDELDIALTSGGENILDAALGAGADLPFACKGGVCCTCKAKIVEGTVRMDVNYSLEPDEVDAGYILTCQSHPTSEKLIVTFDE
jgi:ring-1,2-phenylacetyl-CoA epoxidase subunit PaaE